MNKIKVGFFSVTELDGDPEAYVVWHQLDHMGEQLRIPGLSWGQRFFASPGCVAASAYRQGSMAKACHFQNYLFERYEPVMTEFLALGRALDAVGRSRPPAPPHIQSSLQLVQTYAAPRVLIAPEAVAYRPNTGVYLLVEDVTEPDGVAEWRVRQHTENVPSMLEIPGVVGQWVYAASGYGGSSDRGAYGIPASTIQISVIYLDADPIPVSRALEPHLERRWKDAPMQPLLAGAFRSYFPPPTRFCSNDDPDW
jgi:hypothetical protein